MKETMFVRAVAWERDDAYQEAVDRLAAEFGADGFEVSKVEYQFHGARWTVLVWAESPEVVPS